MCSYNNLFIGTALNPQHSWLVGWDTLVRLVSLYHLIMVPIRIGLNTSSTIMSPLALSTDLTADCCLLFHLLLAFNIAYKNSKSQWITSRYRISKNIDWIVAFAVIPFDLIVFLSGLDPQSAVCCRLNKLFLIFSGIGPSKIIYSTRGDSILDLHIILAIILRVNHHLMRYDFIH